MPPPKKNREPRRRQPPTTPVNLAADPSSLITEAKSSLSSRPLARRSPAVNTPSSDVLRASANSFDPNSLITEANSPLSSRPWARRSPAVNTAISDVHRPSAQSFHRLPPKETEIAHKKARIDQNQTQLQHLKICIERVRRYIQHFRQRPRDNSTMYWQKFAAEFYAPNAKQRWCFSSQNDVSLAEYYGQIVGCQATEAAWGCDHCGATSGKGFEATFETLPRLWQIKFEHGLIEELFSLSTPHGTWLPSGTVVLEFAKATQQSSYVQERAIHEGRLRIIFTPNLKILFWEFCVTHHEEFFSRSSLAPQVNLFYETAQNYQTALAKNGSGSLSPQTLLNFCNTLMTTTDMLVKSLEPQSLTLLGLSKGFARPLQVSEVGQGMKNSTDVSQGYKIEPLGFTQEAHPVANIVQQNDNTRSLDVIHSLNGMKEAPKQSFGDPGVSGYVEVESTMINSGGTKEAPEQSFGDPRVSGYVEGESTMINSGGTKEVPEQSFGDPGVSGYVEGESTMIKSGGTKGAPKQFFGDPSVSGCVEGESTMISSGSRKNGAGSAKSPASISNVARGTSSCGNHELGTPAEGIPPSSSDHTYLMDSYWNVFTDNDLVSLEELLA